MPSLNLYNTTSDKKMLNKNINLLKKIDNIHFKNGCSMENPIIQITSNALGSLANCNYAYVSDFQRFYFINDITLVSNNVLELSMHVDVLMSFNSSIKQVQALILRQENINNPYIIDSELITFSQRILERHKIGNSPFSISAFGQQSECISLTVVGGV